MAINERLVHTASAAAAGTGNQEEGLILHLDANDVDSYDGDGTEWVDITNHEYTPTTNVSEHFNTVLYTGNGTSSISVNGAGFQPDLIIQKNRDASSSFNWYDSVRGATKLIYSSGNAGQVTYSGITSFDSDGFTNGSSENANTNKYVAWCFKAGGAAVSNTDGTITSQVSANNNLGFSIVKWSGDNSAATIGHGLDIAPEIVIRKNLASSSSWAFDTSGIDGSWDYLFLDTTAASANHSSLQPPSSTTFNTSGTSYNSSSMIAYCFASKRGVSKVGSYVGKTGSVKVYTGFEPAFVLIKKTNTTTNANWSIFDNARVNGTVKGQLYPDSSSVENDRNGLISFNRDGFTLENNTVGQVNTNNDSYIYYAVAKDTNETSLIPDTDLELHLDAASFPEYGEAGYFPTPFTWIDSSVNGNNGTITGATFDSELGNYLDIPLDSSYIDVPTANMLDSDFTIEMWYNINSTSSSYKMLLGGSEYQNQTGLGHYIYGDTLKTWVSISGATTNVLTSQSALIANTWHHIVLRREGSTWTQYVDGNEVGTATGTTSSLSSANSRIGRHYNLTGLNAAGKSGQVRIYSSALTQDQIRQNFNFTKPSYPNGFNGTISGASFLPSAVSFDFDGNNDYVSLDSNFRAAFDKPNRSMAMWIKWDGKSTGFGMPFFMTGAGLTNGRFAVQLNHTTAQLNVFVGDAGSYPQATLTANTWTLISVVQSSNSYEVFVNDTSIGTATNNNYTATSTATSHIGSYLNTNHYWSGEISDVKFYSRALTGAEVTAKYNLGYNGII
jgi:hypothetical protein